MSDKRWGVPDAGNSAEIEHWVADVVSVGDYYPFGLSMPGRMTNDYRYGFNGKEDDNETGTQDYGMRIYKPGLGKFLSVDPITDEYPELTPYQFASNRPIDGIDQDGLEYQPYKYRYTDGRTTVNLFMQDPGGVLNDGANFINRLFNPISNIFDNGYSIAAGKNFYTNESVSRTDAGVNLFMFGVGYRGSTVLFKTTPAFQMEMQLNKASAVMNVPAPRPVVNFGQLGQMPANFTFGKFSLKSNFRYRGNNILESSFAQKEIGDTKYLIGGTKRPVQFIAANNVEATISGITKKYGLYKCMECADDVVKALQKSGIKGEVLDVKTNGNSGMAANIWSDALQTNISTNGRHRAVLVNGKVYDNINPNGITYDQWLKDLHSPTGYTIEHKPF